MALSVKAYLDSNSKAAPLAAFRIFFGIMMFASIIRFWSYGWIKKLYIDPGFFFSYYGFEFVKPLGEYTYLLFAICGLSSLAIAIGFYYRISIVTFFLSFTYIELMDKTTYLNHYYFISILSFLLIFFPANATFSWDALKYPEKRFEYVPSWSIDSIKLLLAIVYFYAGLAKLNSDWLFLGMPLKIWLPSKYGIPLLGSLFQEQWMIYLFSWSGAIYDLSIPFLLVNRKTRPFAFILVVVFHVLTRILFPIGMFPYIMIVSATIFFSSNFHERVLRFISRMIKVNFDTFQNGKYLKLKEKFRKPLITIIVVFFICQLIIPFRYLAYPGELFWTEQGYRFSWRVMLMDKVGSAQFKIVNHDTGDWFYVDNTRYLTAFQEKQMSTQPDFIIEYAHFLRDQFQTDFGAMPGVYVDSYVALNGRGSTPYISPETNLAEIKLNLKNRDWILPFNDEIKGL